MARSGAGPFRMRRLGVVMQPNPGAEDERKGVLNPGAARGPDGTLYLFPRLVDGANRSCIGVARVRFNPHGDPASVERLAYALEPREPFERQPQKGTAGCEDPRVTYLEPLQQYVMAYVALGPSGPWAPAVLASPWPSPRTYGPGRAWGLSIWAIPPTAPISTTTATKTALCSRTR